MSFSSFKSWFGPLSRLRGQGRGPTLETLVVNYLAAPTQAVRQAPSDEAALRTLWETLEPLLASDDPAVPYALLSWFFNLLSEPEPLPESFLTATVTRLRRFRHESLATPLLTHIQRHPQPESLGLLTWLADLDWKDSARRATTIDALAGAYLADHYGESAWLNTLLQLDRTQGDLADQLLQQFPGKHVERNRRIIATLGETNRYRIIRPLINFAESCPEYTRPVLRALARFEVDDADLFFLRCLDKRFVSSPMVLIEAVKQVRRRKLRKAIPLLDALFPVESHLPGMVNRTVNGEIALTMAHFGAYAWAREQMLPVMLTEGVNPKYLKAIELLTLEEAVPLLKAIILAPENPALKAIQHHACRICKQLLTQQRMQLATLSAEAATMTGDRLH